MRKGTPLVSTCLRSCWAAFFSILLSSIFPQPAKCKKADGCQGVFVTNGGPYGGVHSSVGRRCMGDQKMEVRRSMGSPRKS